jgi:hypothetical protein
VIRTFIAGYNLAPAGRDPARLARRLDISFEPASAGAGDEGSRSYFGLIDLPVPWGESGLAAFPRSKGRSGSRIASMGAGFAIARAGLGFRQPESYQGAANVIDRVAARRKRG